MKDYFNLRKSKLLLFALLTAFAGGVSPAWADVRTEGFASGETLPDGWSISGGGVLGTNYSLTSDYNKTGSDGDYCLGRSSTSDTSPVTYIITPTVTGSVTIYYRSWGTGSGNKKIFVYKWNGTAIDGNALFSDQGTTSSYQSMVINLGTTETQLAIRLQKTVIDDFTADFVGTNAIAKPSAFAASNITTNSAQLGWTAGGEETAWQIVYSTDASFDKDAAEKINVNTTSYALTGLSENTNYYAAVRAFISETKQSAWVTTSFKTPMAPITSFPWNETFNDITSGIPTGWDNSEGSTTNDSYKWTSYSSGHDGRGLRFDSYNNYTNNTNFLKTPNMSFQAGTAMQLKFWYKNPKGGDFSVYISNDGGVTYETALATGLTGASDWTEKEIAIPSGYSENVVIVFKGTSNYGSGDAYIYLDDVTVEEKLAGANFAINTDGTTTENIGVAAVNEVAEKTFTITNNGTADLVVNVTNDTDFSVVKTIRFSNSKNWGAVYLHAWNDEGDLDGGWPGIQQTITDGKNEFNQDIYVVEIPAGTTKIIMHNNSGTQSETIDMNYNKRGLYIDDNNNGVFFDDGYLNVPAGGSTDIKVQMKSATSGIKNGNIVLAFDAVNVAYNTFTIPVTGAVMPMGAVVVDFNTTIPSRWENESNAWTIENGAAKCTSNKKLTTQKLDFSSETSPFFIMKVKSTSTSSSGDQIVVEGSTDNGATWTAFDAITKSYNNGDFGTSASDYSAIVISIPNTVNKLRFTGKYVLVDEIAGLIYSNNDPNISVTTFDLPNPVPVTSGTLKDFGWSNTNVDVLYFISNSGTGTLNISNIDVPAGFTAGTVGNAMTVAAGGEPLTMTVTMTSGVVGPLGGTVTLTTDGGNFEIPVKGFVYGNKNLVDFTNASQYAGWTTEGWTISDGVASVASSKTMQTTKFSVDANEKLYVEAKSNGSYYNSANLTYSYSTDNGANWIAGESAIIASTTSSSDYAVYTLSDIADTEATRTVLIQFTGANVAINHIYGFTAVATAVMETTAKDIAFGTQTAESAEQTFTISNTGTAELTGLSVTLGKTGEDAEYSVRMTDSEDAEFTGSTLAAGATITVHVKQLFDSNKLGSKSDVLTIAATDQTPVAINLSGTTRDPLELYVDFNSSNEWPAEILEHGTNWTVYNYNGSGEARQGNNSTATSLTLTPLTVASTEDKLTFDVAYYNYSSYRELTVSYTTDGGLTWTNYNWGTEQEPVYDLKQSIGYSYATQTITGIPAGTVVFKFTGKCIKLDNISGDMKNTTAPLMTFTETANNIDGANLKADGTATYTLANNGNADYVATVATTNVTAEVTGDNVTFEGTALTIPAGKTATITVTMAFASPYGDKTGKLEITSESWVGDITADYNATLVDPTDFVEDFANGKPAGWYNGGWTISGGDAHVYTGTAKELITEKLGVESGKNVLSFDAKVYTGSDNQTLNVYTSTDRKTWSVAYAFTLTSDVQSFSFTALAADSYVKFEASNASIDNLTGVKKLDAPAHDLYQIGEATQPATGVPGASCTASMTAVSLRADETMIAELWLKKGEYYHKVASLENEAMTVDVNKTFTLTGNLPAEEGEYKMWITIKNSDNSAYINTDETDFTIAHTRTMDITNFENAPAAQANDNNEFEGTFTVTVQNTGSKSLAADEVSVTLIDNDDAESTFTKTLADVLFIETSNGTVDISKDNDNNDAKLGVWMWNPGAGEWAELTKIRDGFYSVDLKGNTYYKVVRQQAGMDFDFTTCWNETGEISFADGNLRTFNNWGSGKDMILNAGTFSLTNGQTIPVKVTVSGTLTDGEDASFNFKAKENVSNTFYGSGLIRSVNITAAPVIELDEAVGTIASTGANRKVQLTRSFVAGWNTICLPFAVTDLSVFGQGTTAYEFYEFVNGEIKFTAVNALAAGTPYLMNVPAAKTAAKTDAIEFTNVTVASDNLIDVENGGVTFKGTYTGIAAMDASKYSVTNKGNLKAGDGVHALKGFRAYFTGISITSDARLSIVEGEGQGIAGVVADGVLNTEVYNLNGQRVETLKKGQLYIINGKKQVVK